MIGIELSSVLAKKAKKLAKYANADFDVIVCDAENLPIKESSIDICYCGYVLHHFKILSQLFPEACKNFKT